MGIVILTLFMVALTFSLVMAYKLVLGLVAPRSGDALGDVGGSIEEIRLLNLAKSAALADIKGLQFDHDIGHLTNEDYSALRDKAESRAIGLMKKLDALKGSKDYDAVIDVELDRRLGLPAARQGTRVPGTPSSRLPATPSSKAGGCSGCGATMADDDLFCASCGVGRASTATCGRCAERLVAGAKFCKYCGTPIEGVAEVST